MWCVDKFLNAFHTVRCKNNHVTGSLLASGFKTVASDVLWVGARLVIWIYHVFIYYNSVYYNLLPGVVAPSPQQQRSSCFAGKTPRLLLAQGPIGHPVAL